jgi:hypothetical protein
VRSSSPAADPIPGGMILYGLIAALLAVQLLLPSHDD